jgi:hypothetical protein
MQSESDPIVKGYVYEEIRRYDSDIPPDKYFELLRQLREKIDGSEYGLKTQYIEVNEKWVRVQFAKTGSPLITWAQVIQIIVIAISIALVGWAASLLVHELYKLATVLGSETVNMFLNVITLFIMLSLFSPMIDMVTKAFRRKE